MKTVFETRASTILYNFLRSGDFRGMFLLPANICPIVPITFQKAGIDFELVDISKEHFCIDENAVFEKVKYQPYKYAGLLFSRTYGFGGDFEYFFRELKALPNECFIIDDRCLHVPEFERGDTSVADLVIYSTGHAKVVDLNIGGYGFLNESFMYRSFQTPYDPQSLETLTISYKDAIDRKKKWDYVDSDWLDTKKPIESFTTYRKKVSFELTQTLQMKSVINNVYRENLPAHIQFPNGYDNWRFNILVPQRDALLEKIFKENLFASAHFVPVNSIFRQGSAENAESLHKNVMNLFNDKYFDVNKAAQIVEIIKDHLVLL